MTTMFKEDITCSICNQKSSHTRVGSTNAFGSSDLDTRAPEMQRSTMTHWVQRCPSCGYCSPDISECNEMASELVKSETYQSIVISRSMPELAASFLARSYEHEQQGNFSNAAWKAIHAAWVCDDKKDMDLSKTCKEKAIHLIEAAQSEGQKIVDQEGASEAICVDLLRRSGMFQQALDLCLRTNDMNVDEIILQVLQLEEELIMKEDMPAHTIAEALGEM